MGSAHRTGSSCWRAAIVSRSSGHIEPEPRTRRVENDGPDAGFSPRASLLDLNARFRSAVRASTSIYARRASLHARLLRPTDLVSVRSEWSAPSAIPSCGR